MVKREAPDPFKQERIRDSIDLDVAASRASGYYKMVVQDRQTLALGKQITEALLRLHLFQLQQKKREWDEQYSFMGGSILRLANWTGINAGVLEAIRRGFFPYHAIDIELERRIEMTMTSINLSVANAHLR